jgi:hypothetical protein
MVKNVVVADALVEKRIAAKRHESKMSTNTLQICRVFFLEK